MIKNYDAVILGFGKGGKTLAAFLADRGQSVALVERSDAMYGGACINIACIPTKAMIHEAHKAVCRGLETFADKAAAYKAAVAHKNTITALLRRKNYEDLANREHCDVFTGTASFRSAHEVVVTGQAEELVLHGEKIFINTGGESVLPPVPGVRESARVYTSTTLLDLEELPRRLAIVGGGYIALEFASFFAMFGSEVTMLEREARLLPREDEDVAASVRGALEAQGVTVITGSRVEAIRDGADETEVACTRDGNRFVVAADAVLLATGRRPMTEGLNLEAAGVKLTEQGAIAVDERLHTSAPGIWALGDVKGGPQFTYISLDDFRIIRDELFGQGKRVTGDRDPAYTVFTEPPLARLGLTEEAARARYGEVLVATLPTAAIPRAVLMGEGTGLLKAVVDPKTGAILGCALHCANAGEMINTVEAAVHAGKEYTFLRDMIYMHPSMTEALNMLFGQLR